MADVEQRQKMIPLITWNSLWSTCLRVDVWSQCDGFGFFGSKLILSNNQSKATLWVLSTHLRLRLWIFRACVWLLDLFLRHNCDVNYSFSELHGFLCLLRCWHLHQDFKNPSQRIEYDSSSGIDEYFVAHIRYCSVDDGLIDRNDRSEKQIDVSIDTAEVYWLLSTSFAS